MALLKSSVYPANFIVSYGISLSYVGFRCLNLKSDFIVSCQVSLSHVEYHHLILNFIVLNRRSNFSVSCRISLSHVKFHCPMSNFIVSCRESLVLERTGQISYLREPGFFASIMRLTKSLQDFQQTPNTKMR